ncbi:MAG: hypothetical protein IJG40_07035 [Oscillospiraceae bacterium]|nr:hypothetical protein [Oscillospiraceae bacterium]
MNIIADAKARKNVVQNNRDLFALQKEMLKTMFLHHAISEVEYHRSLELLAKRTGQ